MPDPIEQLSNFDPGVPVNPLPAAEVRRRGDRLRRRNTAVVGGGAVAAVLLVAVPVAVVAGGDGGEPQPAPPVGLTDEVLLNADEVPARERLTPWRQVESEGPVLACAPDGAALDPASSVRRDFAADVAGAPADQIPVSAVRTQVLQFEDASEARDSYGQAQRWVLGCPGGDELAAKGVSKYTVELADGEGEWQRHDFYAPDICTECDAIRFDRMGVAQFGDRVVLVSLAEVGGPLEPEGLDATMERLFDAAITRAGGEITGGSASGEGSAEPPSAAGVDGVPLDWDLVDMRGDGGKIYGPGPEARGADEVSPCDEVVWPEAGVDRSAVTTTGPEFVESRELVELASADEAVAAMERIRSAIAACPTEINELDPTSNPEQAWEVLPADTGYDSVTFSLTYTDGLPGGTIWQLTRVGRAILAVSTGGEYSGGDSASFAAERLTEITDRMTPAMCAFTEAGCGG